uniref:Uncharacterized protein n=1 Tax=Geoglobus ahangari TaxID=113653 RepID=A0A7J3TI78_9EURY
MIGKIREACRQVEVDAIIGYRKKEGEPREILHVFKPDEIDKITFSPLSSNNPARLLMEILPHNEQGCSNCKGV